MVLLLPWEPSPDSRSASAEILELVPDLVPRLVRFATEPYRCIAQAGRAVCTLDSGRVPYVCEVLAQSLIISIDGEHDVGRRCVAAPKPVVVVCAERTWQLELWREEAHSGGGGEGEGQDRDVGAVRL